MNSRSAIKKNIFAKVYHLLVNAGLSGFLYQLKDYVYYNIIDKWKFVYFELNLNKLPYSLPDKQESLVVRRVNNSDISKIQKELYPYMGKKQEYDKRYIENIDEYRYECFIAEVEGKVVHYFMVFSNAKESPLIDTPFKKEKIKENDIYLGNTFTIPSARGMWIVPHVMLDIILYYQKNSNATRALLLVHEDTPGAVGFFKRLGFNVINNASPKNIFDVWFK